MQQAMYAASEAEAGLEGVLGLSLLHVYLQVAIYDHGFLVPLVKTHSTHLLHSGSPQPDDVQLAVQSGGGPLGRLGQTL